MRRPADWFLVACWILGGCLVALISAALLAIALPELADIPHLIRVAGETGVLESIFLTIAAGAIAVGILFVFGTPLSYVLARDRRPWSGAAGTLIDIPLILPHTVAGILVYLLFSTRGLIGGPLASAGIFFEDAFPGIVVAMVFVSIPYYVRAVREGFAKVPVHLENVARSLGASRFQTFFRVTLPLSYRHIWSGALLAWGRAVGEFAAVVIIAYFPMVVSTLIYQRFTTSGLAESRSIAFLMILIFVAVFAGFGLVTRGMGRDHDRA
ncbi:MAG: ABC transporter permease [Methanoregulaceae archaeon]|nr:ABC transporter permease [Methanoregulaceae archaeon]